MTGVLYYEQMVFSEVLVAVISRTSYDFWDRDLKNNGPGGSFAKPASNF